MVLSVVFASGGPDDGHTAWQFDAFGNIIKIGDLVATCHFSTTNAPVLGLLTWVSRYDFLSANPSTLAFGSEFDGDGNGAVYGYADVEIPLNSLYGCGLEIRILALAHLGNLEYLRRFQHFL